MISDISGKKEYSYEEQMRLVTENPNNIGLILYPHRDTQWKAVNREFCEHLIEYIEDPDPKLIKMCLNNSPSTYTYIRNPTEEHMWLIIKNGSCYINLIENPSEEMQIYAISNPGIFKTVKQIMDGIKNPTEKVKRLAVEKDPYAVLSIKNPSIELQMLAVQKEPDVITHWHPVFGNRKELDGRVKFDRSVILAAIEKNFNLIGIIDDVPEELQIKAVKSKFFYIDWIKNPCKRAQEIAYEIICRTMGSVAPVYIKRLDKEFREKYLLEYPNPKNEKFLNLSDD
jgi:hypothetical protein